MEDRRILIISMVVFDKTKVAVIAFITLSATACSSGGSSSSDDNAVDPGDSSVDPSDGIAGIDDSETVDEEPGTPGNIGGGSTAVGTLSARFIPSRPSARWIIR